MARKAVGTRKLTKEGVREKARKMTKAKARPAMAMGTTRMPVLVRATAASAR